MTHAAATSGALDLSLCGRRIFRGRYLFVKDPTCSVCQRIAARLPSGLPAAPDKGKNAHLYKSKTQRSGGLADA